MTPRGTRSLPRPAAGSLAPTATGGGWLLTPEFARPTLRSIVLVRHGTTALNADRRYQGATDGALLPEGRTQAAALQGVLEPLAAAGALVFTSDMARTRQTAALALPDCVSLPDSRLRELDFGRFEGLTHAQCAERFADCYGAWLSQPEAVSPPEGESLSRLTGRCADWLHDIATARSVIAFTHGGPMRVLLGLLTGVLFRQARLMEIPPAAVLRFRERTDQEPAT